jgi:hypothetical protein
VAARVDALRKLKGKKHEKEEKQKAVEAQSKARCDKAQQASQPVFCPVSRLPQRDPRNTF